MSAFLKKGKYGLIKPGAKNTSAKTVARPSVFADSSSDEENDGKKHVNVSLKREHEKRKKQTEEAAAQALSEDPSIFEYDSIYDKMTEEKKKKNPKLLKDAKPKYIDALKRAAERRKLEGELVYEHQAQKEIEKDQEEFREKESFVTSAYKKKLAERRALEEELAREAAVEAANDITKQKDLSRFHKHLFKQTVTPDTSTEKGCEQPSSQSGETENGSSQREDKSTGRDDGGKSGETERRRSSEKEGGGGGERERRRASDRERGGKDRQERERRYSRDRVERERRHSRDGQSSQVRDERHQERRSSYRERRDSHARERTPDRPRGHRSNSPTTETSPEEKQEKNDESSLPAKKKTKIQAGIEIEVEEIDPVERRRLAAIKKATEETTQSAKDRYLARKREKAGTEARKPSTSDE